MKVALVTELYSPSVGGQEVRFKELGQELIRAGWSVTVYTIGHQAGLKAEETESGILIKRVFFCPRYQSGRFRRSPFGIIGFTKVLLQRRTELQAFDHVVFNIWPVLPALILAPKLRGSASVDVCEIRSGAFWSFIYKRLASQRGTKILGVSPDIVRTMCSRFGLDPRNGHVLVSGVDVPSIPLNMGERDPKLILFFGRLSQHKNPELLIQAFLNSLLPAKGFRLTIAGAGPLYEPLTESYRHPSVAFLGRISDDEKWRWLARASLLVLPSRREGFPRVVAEGAAVGTPTLTLDYPDNGTSSVVRDYRLGRSVEPTEPALRRALDQFSEDAANFREISSTLQLRARREFSWDAVTHRFIDFLSHRAHRV